MTRDEIAALKQQVDWLRPAMSIELPVSVVRALIELIEAPRHCLICASEASDADFGAGDD